MKIAIAGAGAIGGWLGVLLAQSGHQVSALARGATLHALVSGPWRLAIDGTMIEQRVDASDNAADLGVQDIVLVTVKGPALASMAPRINPLLGPKTIVVPVMNGVPWWFVLTGAGALGPTPLTSVDPDGRIASALAFDRVLGAVAHASVSVAGPGHVVHKAGKGLILGEPLGGFSKRLDSVLCVFGGTGIDATASDAIRRDIWYKLWGNMTMNPLSAVTGATCDRILDDPLVNRFVLSVMAEAQTIGALIDCPIDERGEDRNVVTRKLGAFKTSMLQDAQSNSHLEIDGIVAAPQEIARKLGIATPNIDTLLGLVRVFAQTRGLYPGLD